MKMIYHGIQRIDGFKKADGEPFSMTVCYVGVPIEAGAFGKNPAKKTVITGHGMKHAEIEAVPEAVAQFETVASGSLVDFETDQRFFMGELKTVITGVKAQIQGGVKRVA